LRLVELGLLQADTNIMMKIRQLSENIDIYVSGKYIIKTTKKANTPEYQIPTLILTKIGKELKSLLSPVAIDSYIKDFFLYLQKTGLDTEYAFILNINNDNTITHTQPWMKF
jgi:hypothetical protein